MRLSVIVDGAHDEALVTTWDGSQLATAQARVVALRGTQDVNTLMDFQVLTEFTGARVLVLLDRTRPDLSRAWDRVLATPEERRL